MKVNGKDYLLNILNEKTLNSLLENLKISEKMVVIELNKEIVPKEKYNQVKLEETDNIEIIHFVGGGS